MAPSVYGGERVVMSEDTEEKKRPQLRLVVDNAERRKPGPSGKEEEFIPMEELLAQRGGLRNEFYRDMHPWQAKAYASLERFLTGRGWPYGLDPKHGRLMVLPASVVCPGALEHGGSPQDEALLYIAEDAAGKGLCLSLETILPYYSDDEDLMEDALLYSPVLQYGTLFLEENPQDGLLDLIYRLAFPLYPPAATGRLLERFFSVAAFELGEALRSLTGDSEP